MSPNNWNMHINGWHLVCAHCLEWRQFYWPGGHRASRSTKNRYMQSTLHRSNHLHTFGGFVVFPASRHFDISKIAVASINIVLHRSNVSRIINQNPCRFMSCVGLLNVQTVQLQCIALWWPHTQLSVRDSPRHTEFLHYLSIIFCLSISMPKQFSYILDVILFVCLFFWYSEIKFPIAVRAWVGLSLHTYKQT